MHICFITHEYPKKGSAQGGIGSVVQTIAKALQKKGHTVSVIGVGKFYKVDFEVEDDSGIKVYRYKGANWKLGNFIPNTKTLLKGIRKIHAQDPIDVIEGADLDLAFFPKNYFTKKIIRMHGGHRFFAESMGIKPSPWRSFQETLSFSKADSLLAVSEYVGNKSKELIGFKKEFSTIYNIIDTKKFFLADRKKQVAKKIVFVGTVMEKKGIRQLILAIPEIVKRFPEAQLDVIGRDSKIPGTNKSYMEYLKTEIPKEVKKNINLLGVLSHDRIPSILESSEVCVYPSHMEAMPIAWLEALGMGKSVVASNLGPGSEVIEDKVTGLLCNPLEPLDIAEKIIWMFDNPMLAEKMGVNAREDILDRFNSEKMINKNIDFYEQLIGKK